MIASILFAYNFNIEHEAASVRTGRAPTHRLFGFIEVRKAGGNAAFISAPEFIRRLTPRFWKPYQALVTVFTQFRYNAVVACHESAAFPLLLCRRLRLLRIPVVVVNVALLSPANRTGLRKGCVKWLLKGAEVIVSYASEQSRLLIEEFDVDADCCRFLPFGIDTDFFHPEEQTTSSPHVLSVGTNAGKDYETLLAALPDNLELRIVSDPDNVALAKRAARPTQVLYTYTAVDIEQIRRMYQAAGTVVIPLKDVEFSSGQTVLLETMALGCIVIVSDVIATRDYISPGQTVIGVPAGDAKALEAAMARVLATPDAYASMRQEAARDVRERFSMTRYATRLIEIINGLARPSQPQRASTASS